MAIRQEAAASSKPSAERDFSLLTDVAEGVTVHDAEGRLVFANEAAAELCGFSSVEALLSSKELQIVDENGAPVRPTDLPGRRVLAGLDAPERWVRFASASGGEGRWVLISARRLRSDPSLAISTLTDATRVLQSKARELVEVESARSLRYGALRADVTEALAAHRGISEMLQDCCESLVEHVHVSFARVWLADPTGEYLDLVASAGKYTHLDGAHRRVKVGDFKIGKIASERRAHLTNDVLHDPRVGNPAWAEREGMVAFAGYPLIVGEHLVGVMAAFATRPLPDDTLAALGSVGVAIAQGIERRRAELELEERARDLARSNADLEQFAYVASHDLQEPLRMVASYVQLLERRYKDKLDDDARDFIGFAVEGATRMRQLVDDLLLYSRVGTRGKELSPVDLEGVLRAVQKNLERTIVESQAVITSDPLPTLLGDQGQLIQLLQNLVGNAIKFRRDEPPRVHVSAKRDDTHWTISVKDNGIGIEPAYFERIFVIFQRLNQRERYPGTGIGLAIAKKIVERHGGVISVQSTPGEGSTISFTVPIAPRARRSAP
jgi:PAS domain S-box-containing protein